MEKSYRDTGYDQSDSRHDYSRLEDSQERRDIGRRRASEESPRKRSTDQHEAKERKERRRRQSGDIEGLREREEMTESRDSHRRHGDESRRHGDESRRHGDRDDYRSRGDDSRGQRRHSKSRRSVEGSQFQDVSTCNSIMVSSYSNLCPYLRTIVKECPSSKSPTFFKYKRNNI